MPQQPHSIINCTLSTLRLRLLELPSNCDTPVTEILLPPFAFDSSFDKISLRLQDFQPHYFEKLSFFPSKNHREI